MQVVDIEKIVSELYEHMSNRFYGKYKATVADNNDPDNSAKLVLKVPDVYGEEDSPWALPCLPAGKEHGFVVLPQNGENVWAEFCGGNPSIPIWSGGWWSKNELPSPGGIQTRVFVTPKGHKIIIDDEKDEMKLLHSEGAEISLTSDEIKLQIGGSKIVLSRDEVSINDGALQVK